MKAVFLRAGELVFVKGGTRRRERFLRDKFRLVGVGEVAFFAATYDMKYTKLALASLAVVFTVSMRASDRWETLRAINWVENPTNQTHVGRFGELGPYQFRPTTWRMHTRMPFRLATDRAAADEVAVMHYEWIKRALEGSGVDPNPFNIALAWNCGVDAVLEGRAPEASYGYAERVANLVSALKARVQPMAVEEKPHSPAPVDLHLEETPGEIRFRVIQDAPRFVLAG